MTHNLDVVKDRSSNVLQTGHDHKIIENLIKSMQEEKDRLLKKSLELRNDMTELSTGSSEDGDRAVKNDSFEEKRARLNKNNQKLEKIKYALKQFDEGGFGICTVCGEYISIKRLKALQFDPCPLCVDCQNVAEQRNKRHGARYVA